MSSGGGGGGGGGGVSSGGGGGGFDFTSVPDASGGISDEDGATVPLFSAGTNITSLRVSLLSVSGILEASLEHSILRMEWFRFAFIFSWEKRE